jgi:NADPH-dependent curcumin reductase CurA
LNLIEKESVQMNRLITLKSYSHGKALTEDNFELKESKIPSLKQGQVFLKVLSWELILQ